MPGNVDPEVTNKVLIPKIIRERYPDLDEEEVEEVRQQVVVDSVIKNGEVREVGDKRFIKMAGKFVNIDDININLIDSVNPFQRAFEVISKSVTKQVLKVIQDAIDTTRIEMTPEEALVLWPKIQAFVREHGRRPERSSTDPLEQRMADAVSVAAGRAAQTGPVTIDADTLRRMIAEDDLGLLTLPVKTQPLSADERLIASFGEITQFVREHDREPADGAMDVAEIKLFHRLAAVRADEANREALQPYDDLELLHEPEPPSSLEEAIASDPLGVLDAPKEDIFTLRNVPKASTQPDRVAQRKRSEDFDRFEPLFKQCQAELRSGARKLIAFRNEQEIKLDTFYVLRGMLVYVAAEGERRKEHGRVNARLRCIFENGTEADLLLRSLASQLYRFGKGRYRSRGEDRRGDRRTTRSAAGIRLRAAIPLGRPSGRRYP